MATDYCFHTTCFREMRERPIKLRFNKRIFGLAATAACWFSALTSPISSPYSRRHFASSSRSSCSLPTKDANTKKKPLDIFTVRTDGKGLNSSKHLQLKRNTIDKEDEKIPIQNDILTPNFHIDWQDRPPPLVQALKNSAEQNAASFHFPGHNRGKAAPSSLTRVIGRRPFLHDLPEIPELEKLLSRERPILDAQRQAAKLFGSSETWFLTGGTTCGVQAAIMATCSDGDILILPRNSHISAISAMVLSGAIPKYIVPNYNLEWDIVGGVTTSQVENAIKELKAEGKKATAVFVTSPTYHGLCSNLSAISQLCYSHGIPMIVDEAHGAHLGFHSQMPKSALQQGADLVIQSTHKCLCSLTQSSMLHMSRNYVDRERICRCLQTLQSTSPSYLLLASLDAARAQVSEKPKTIFNKAMKLAFEAKDLIRSIPGVSVLDHLDFPDSTAIDPLRLTTGFQQLGLSGYEADEILYREQGIVPELVDIHSITFAINIGTCCEHLQRLVSGIKYLSATSLCNGVMQKKEVMDTGFVPFTDISIKLSPRDAFFACKKRVSTTESLGEICGELICPFPPGIPVLIQGEIITEIALDYLLRARNMGVVIRGASDPSLSSIVVCNL